MGNHKPSYDHFYSSRTQAYPQPWANPKHAHSQVNGETQMTQDLVILKNQTRKQS
ncbi:YpzG family protein [Bacillus sp. FJAT-42376]|uniref:YpzG family protein n=1 Tax=Bacillus sp. FJAT-42376 TaxID=2014076 RepID=UPI000F4E5CB6|nr:YpzG family protein [Bacillus sp. FJAT-42376]AZB41891.1 YpzG family protein [Bacillus sp. FJAT-42376]